MKKLLVFAALVFLPGLARAQYYLDLDALTSPSTTNTSSPGWNIDTVPANTGGANSPASASQATGVSSPCSGAPSGTSMSMSVTTSATSTQTNALFWLWLTGNDSATTFVSNRWICVTNIGAANNIEMDSAQYNLTLGREFMFGWQCNLGGYWQIDNLAHGWENTTVACSWPTGWNNVITVGHRTPGDTSCGGVACNNYDKLILNGATYSINMTLPSETLLYSTSALIDQFQIDISATSGTAQTVSYNVDDVNFNAYIPAPPAHSAGMF